MKVNKDNNVVEVDTLSDLLELVAQQGIQVKISDTSKLRHIDIEESFEEDEQMKTNKTELANDNGITVSGLRDTPEWWEIADKNANPNGKVHIEVDIPNTISKSATLTQANGGVRFEIEQENIDMFIDLLQTAKKKLNQIDIPNPMIDRLVEIYQEKLDNKEDR